MPVCFLNDNLAEEERGCQVLLGWLRGMCTFLFACVFLSLSSFFFKKKINIAIFFKNSRHCHDLIALLRLHNWRLWVCIPVCLCVWVFFPFKSCCYCCRRSRCKRKASMRSSFVFHFTFRVTFSANCSLLTVANPRLGKINFQNVGGREGRASPSVPNGGGFLPFDSGPQTYPAHLPPPENPVFLLHTGPRQRIGTQAARSIHPGTDPHVPGWPSLTCISQLPSRV